MLCFQIVKRNWKVRQLTFIILTTFIGINLTDAEEAVKITNFVVPPHVELHDDVVLECEQNIPIGRLFQVIWNHNEEEFYKYTTGNDPPKMQFNNAAGIVVDLKGSSEKKVILLNISLAATGTFECNVIAEDDDFTEDKRSGNLTVVVIPDTKPRIEPPPSEGLSPGSQVNLNCTAAPSIPAATLEWHVNDKPVQESSLKRYPPETLKNGRFVSRLGLHFKLERSHYQSGELKLKCTAKIATYYTKFQVHNHPTPLKEKPRTKGSTNDGGCLKNQWLVQLATMLLMLRR